MEEKQLFLPHITVLHGDIDVFHRHGRLTWEQTCSVKLVVMLRVCVAEGFIGYMLPKKSEILQTI